MCLSSVFDFHLWSCTQDMTRLVWALFSCWLSNDDCDKWHIIYNLHTSIQSPAEEIKVTHAECSGVSDTPTQHQSIVMEYNEVHALSNCIQVQLCGTFFFLRLSYVWVQYYTNILLLHCIYSIILVTRFQTRMNLISVFSSDIRLITVVF